MKKALIIGNWKMNPQKSPEAQTLLKDVIKSIGKKDMQVDVVVAPPSVFIENAAKLQKKSKLMLAAQDCAAYSEGAHTGEVSTAMLKSLGVSHVILGHSERRAQGESEMCIQKKASVVLSAGLSAVVCVGEKTRDHLGTHFGEVETQLHALLPHIEKKTLGRLVLAYEPVWAIGTGRVPTSEEVHEMKLFIQKTISTHCGREAIPKVRIIYGGSVNAQNAHELYTKSEVDGFLVGGASLKAKEFAGIVMSVVNGK
jgi:triosephosphate isomerase (TIM)